MGYFLKNRQIQTGSTGVVIPVGTTAARPLAPTAGFQRYNTTISLMEFWDGSSWQTIDTYGAITYTVDNFTGDGTTVAFTMSVAVSDTTSIQVFVGGLYQSPSTSYTVNGTTTITFVSAPPPSSAINIIHSAD